MDIVDHGWSVMPGTLTSDKGASFVHDNDCRLVAIISNDRMSEFEIRRNVALIANAEKLETSLYNLISAFQKLHDYVVVIDGSHPEECSYCNQTIFARNLIQEIERGNV